MTSDQERPREDRAVIAIVGPLRAGVPTDLCRAVNAQLRAGRRTIVVDLRHVTDLDAAGVGELVHVYRMVAAAGGEVEVADPAERVRKVIEVAGLLGLLSAETPPRPRVPATGASADPRAARPAAPP
jgi:anti-sigma B factor antagonist